MCPQCVHDFYNTPFHDQVWVRVLAEQITKKVFTPLDDDGQTDWIEDYDSFMSRVYNSSEAPSTADLELASFGLLDPPFNSTGEAKRWKAYKLLVWKEWKDKPRAQDNSLPADGDEDSSGWLSARTGTGGPSGDLVRELAKSLPALLQMRVQQYINYINRTPTDSLKNSDAHESLQAISASAYAVKEKSAAVGVEENSST